MSFFSSLFKRDWRYHYDKAKKYLTYDNPGQALQEIKIAIEKCSDLDLEPKEKCNELHDQIAKILYDQALQKLQTHIRAKQPDAAWDTLSLARRFAKTKEQRDALNDLEEELVSGPKKQSQENNPETVDSLDIDEHWNLLLNTISFEQAAIYESFGRTFKKAWVNLHRENIKAAIKGFEEALKENPDEPYILIELARALYANDQAKKALPFLKKANEKLNMIELKLLYAEVLDADKQFNEAEKLLQEAHDINVEDQSVLRAIARHALISGDFKSGIDAIEVLLENSPDDPSLSPLAAQLYDATDDLDNALIYYEKINNYFAEASKQSGKITADPIAIQRASSIYHEKKKNLPRAIDLLQTLLQIADEPSKALIWANIAEIEKTNNNATKESEAIEHALDLLNHLLDSKEYKTNQILIELRKRLTEQQNNKQDTP